jgi:hypothetical protein
LTRGLRAAQVLWTFSIYLEAVAILPQLVRVLDYFAQAFA